MNAARIVWVATLSAVGFAAPGVAHAYSSATAFSDDPVTGGGGGRYFTGTARDRYTCGVCHVGGAVPEIAVDGLPSGPIAWGQTYTFAINVGSEHVGMVAEIADPSGVRLGTIERLAKEELEDGDLCASGLPATALFDEPGRTIATMSPCGAQRLRFAWTAPTVPARGAALYVSAVASDQSMAPEGDGVFVGEYVLEVADEAHAVQTGCAVAGQRDFPGWVAWMLLAWPAIGWRTGRTRRTKRC